MHNEKIYEVYDIYVTLKAEFYRMLTFLAHSIYKVDFL